MSDHTPEETGLDGSTATPASNGSAGIFGANPDRLDVFDLDDFMSNAKRVIRTAHICMDGTLEDHYRQAIEELSALVDENGDPVAGDEEASLADKTQIKALEAKALHLQRRIRESSRAIVFEAMPFDEYEVLEEQLLENQKTRDVKKFNLETIARCAIEPKLTVAQAAQMRKQMNKSQWLELANNAFWVNTTGGTTIPKLPSYLLTPGQETSS